VYVVLGSARILDHPVQRDELGGDDLPHDVLLGVGGRDWFPSCCYLDDRLSRN
jgi:hypothetical protein